MPFSSMPSISSPSCSPKSGSATAAKELAGSEPSSFEASPATGFWPAEVAGDVDLDVVGAGHEAGDRGRFFGFDAGASKICFDLRVDFAAGLFDQAADVDEDVGEAAVGAAWAIADLKVSTSASDSPLGGVDRVFEGVFALRR